MKYWHQQARSALIGLRFFLGYFDLVSAHSRDIARVSLNRLAMPSGGEKERRSESYGEFNQVRPALAFFESTWYLA